MKKLVLATLVASALSFSVNAHAAPTHGQNMQSKSMRTFGAARAPEGFAEFCGKHSSDCRRTSKARMVKLTSRLEAELKAVNQAVNRQVRPVADSVLYKKAEKWAYPTANKGDCEDYALLKKRMLMERGWPASALLMTVVANTRGEGHAVLTVVTDKGDLILDNERSSIKPWNRTGYYYFKRQSPQNPASWIALRSVNPSRAGATAKIGR